MWLSSSCNLNIPWGLFWVFFIFFLSFVLLYVLLIIPFSSLIRDISCALGMSMETNGWKRRTIAKWM
jgi:hypothetical protein